MYLTQFDKNTFLHACDIIGVQDITEQYRHGNDDMEPMIVIVLLNGGSCMVRTPLQVVLMTIEEALENHDHTGNGFEDE